MNCYSGTCTFPYCSQLKSKKIKTRFLLFGVVCYAIEHTVRSITITRMLFTIILKQAIITLHILFHRQGTSIVLHSGKQSKNRHISYTRACSCRMHSSHFHQSKVIFINACVVYICRSITFTAPIHYQRPTQFEQVRVCCHHQIVQTQQNTIKMKLKSY